jgi:hypothetical protein
LEVSLGDVDDAASVCLVATCRAHSQGLPFETAGATKEEMFCSPRKKYFADRGRNVLQQFWGHRTGSWRAMRTPFAVHTLSYRYTSQHAGCFSPFLSLVQIRDTPLRLYRCVTRCVAEYKFRLKKKTPFAAQVSKMMNTSSSVHLIVVAFGMH